MVIQGTATAPATAGLGVFADNRKLPIHRWFPFIEGYSAELVRYALTEAVDTSRVFDPFGGSGTTALTAALIGVDSEFTEANPYMAWVSEVKVNAARQAIELGSDLTVLERIAEDPVHFAASSEQLDHPLLTIDRHRKFFPPGVAQIIVDLLGAIDRRLDGPVRELARLAVAVSITPASDMIRRTDLRRRRPGDTPPVKITQAVSRNLRMVVDDVRTSGPLLVGKAVQLADDARAAYAPDRPFTTIITSPPYLNGTNYGRNTKLELFALGFLDSERELEQLRLSEITAGINNVSTRIAAPTRFDEVEAVADRVAAVTYDQRIPTMIRAYFSDMEIVFARLATLSANHAEFWLDIGDSRYAGVSVPTHGLLATVAEQAGWRQVGELPLRTRRSYDGTVLSQSLLKFEKDGAR